MTAQLIIITICWPCSCVSRYRGAASMLPLDEKVSCGLTRAGQLGPHTRIARLQRIVWQRWPKGTDGALKILATCWVHLSECTSTHHVSELGCHVMPLSHEYWAGHTSLG
jgi:hypothetical protein